MTKICIIGTSHVASLKLAWDKIKNSYKEIEITFFAKQSRGLIDLTVSENCLKPKTDSLRKTLIYTSNGLDHIDPNKYDVFLLYGLGFKINAPTESLFYSQQVLKQSLIDNLEYRLSFIIYKMLRKITSKYIFIGHDPLEALRLDEKLEDTSSNNYLHQVELYNQVIFTEDNTQVISQPEQTLTNGSRTQPMYSINSRKLAIETNSENELHHQSDNFHMNEKFGNLYLQKLFNLIKIVNNKDR